MDAAHHGVRFNVQNDPRGIREDRRVEAYVVVSHVQRPWPAFIQRRDAGQQHRVEVSGEVHLPDKICIIYQSFT